MILITYEPLAKLLSKDNKTITYDDFPLNNVM